jgi:hypothetical protein
MFEPRRFFLKGLVGMSSSAFLFQSCPPIPTPRVRTPVAPPRPAEASADDRPVDVENATDISLEGVRINGQLAEQFTG